MAHEQLQTPELVLAKKEPAIGRAIISVTPNLRQILPREFFENNLAPTSIGFVPYMFSRLSRSRSADLEALLAGYRAIADGTNRETHAAGRFILGEPRNDGNLLRRVNLRLLPSAVNRQIYGERAQLNKLVGREYTPNMVVPTFAVVEPDPAVMEQMGDSFAEAGIVNVTLGPLTIEETPFMNEVRLHPQA